METPKEKFRINDYVIYKEFNEWNEGRISSIVYDDAGEKYNIFSFHTFTEVSIKNSDLISNASPDIRRKMKNSSYSDTFNRVHFPVAMRHILVADKEKCLMNPYDLPVSSNVSKIIQSFVEFFKINGGSNDEDEIKEVQKAFIHSFDSILPTFLLYEKEKEQFKAIQKSPSEVYGFVHLLRHLYFLQKQGLDFVGDNQTKSVIFDYTVYMLDFLLTRFKELSY